ncbi:MAG: hypothetical protein R3C56_28970 [Pirellulaceae bacterium]
MGLAMYSASGILLALLDQHRWQPWFYQLLLYSSVFILGSPRTLARCLTWLTISIYFFSALGKLDAEFLHTVGQQFWQEMLQWVGQVHAVDEPWRERPMALIATLPAVEMLLAAGLAWPKTRRIAGVLAILFHLGLMCLLGPLGLDHSAGVLYWNLQFAGQALCLFVLLAPQNAPNPSVDAEETAGKRWKNRLAITITGLAIALPLGERRGLWDHWTSWALYAPHSSRTEVWIAFTTVDSLPASLQQVIAEERASRESLPEQQSERELDAPDEMPALMVAGTDRALVVGRDANSDLSSSSFSVGSGAGVGGAQIDSEFKVKCIVRSAAARWDGRRKSREYQGKSSIDSAAKNYWLGTTPR